MSTIGALSTTGFANAEDRLEASSPKVSWLLQGPQSEKMTRLKNLAPSLLQKVWAKMKQDLPTATRGNDMPKLKYFDEKNGVDAKVNVGVHSGLFDSDTIQLNAYKLGNKSEEEIEATLYHEAIHTIAEKGSRAIHADPRANQPLTSDPQLGINIADAVKEGLIEHFVIKAGYNHRKNDGLYDLEQTLMSRIVNEVGEDTAKKALFDGDRKAVKKIIDAVVKAKKDIGL